LARDEHAFALEDIPAVGVVAVNAAHPSLDDRVVVLELKKRLFLKVALETGFRISARIDDERAAASSRFHVKTAGAMAHFTAMILLSQPFSRDLNRGVAGVFEIFCHLFMAQSTCFHAYILGAFNLGWGCQQTVNCRAGNNQYHCCYCPQTSHYDCCPKSLFHPSP
jgi:hypothetical protein